MFLSLFLLCSEHPDIIVEKAPLRNTTAIISKKQNTTQIFVKVENKDLCINVDSKTTKSSEKNQTNTEAKYSCNATVMLAALSQTRGVRGHCPLCVYLLFLPAVRQHDHSRRPLLVNHGPEVGRSGRQRSLGHDETVWAPVALHGGGGDTDQSITATSTVAGRREKTGELYMEDEKTYAYVGRVDVFGGSIVFLI